MATNLQQRDFARTLARGLACLEALSGFRTPAGVSRVAGEVGVSRAAARRLLLTLQHLGYVIDDEGRFACAPKVLSLGRGLLGEGGVWSAVAPEVVALADRLNEPCSVSVLDGLEILFVCRDATRRIFTSRLGVGDRLPAHCSSAGKMLLASLPDGELVKLLRGVRLERRGPASITSHRELQSSLQKVRACDYAIAVDEMEAGTLSIAVPLRERRGRAIAAISVASHRSRMSPGGLEAAILPELRRTATKVERILTDCQDRNWTIL